MPEPAPTPSESVISPAGVDRPLPPELVGPPPRELPESFNQGRLALQRRRLFWSCLAAGTACFTLAPLPFVKTLSLYILPLGYLMWIGLAIFVLGLVAYLRAFHSHLLDFGEAYLGGLFLYFSNDSLQRIEFDLARFGVIARVKIFARLELFARGGFDRVPHRRDDYLGINVLLAAQGLDVLLNRTRRHSSFLAVVSSRWPVVRNLCISNLKFQI